ncbi:SAYSvFN domain-containing protein 1 [Turdus rufiventris]|nr:SAYSvFN domain-containing protein 1 [Turdus rufiventris]
MYAGTRGPAERRPGELSAYSVFNPGCAAIAGTLTAEQLERELHYRPAAGRVDVRNIKHTLNVQKADQLTCRTAVNACM